MGGTAKTHLELKGLAGRQTVSLPVSKWGTVRTAVGYSWLSLQQTCLSIQMPSFVCALPYLVPSLEQPELGLTDCPDTQHL